VLKIEKWGQEGYWIP